jgi:hypothetical protein
LFDSFAFLLAKTDVVQGDRGVGAQHEIEIVAKAEPKGQNAQSFGELKSHLLSLPLFQEQQG